MPAKRELSMRQLRHLLRLHQGGCPRARSGDVWAWRGRRSDPRDVCRGFLSESVDRRASLESPPFLREAGGIAVHPSMLGRMRSHYLATIGTTGHFNLVELRGNELTTLLSASRGRAINMILPAVLGNGFVRVCQRYPRWTPSVGPGAVEIKV